MDMKPYLNTHEWVKPPVRRRFTNILETGIRHASDGEPFYGVLASELPIVMSQSFGGGFSVQFAFNPVFQEAIKNRDNGFGNCALICDLDFGRNAAWESSRIAHVFVHEIAHALQHPRPQPTDHVHSEKVNQLVLSQVTTDCATWLDPVEEQLSHGYQFVRTLLHLFHRMTGRGFGLNIHKLMNWGYYGYGDPLRYKTLLTGELSRNQPIREILSQPVSPMFVALWQDDMRAAVQKGPKSPSDLRFEKLYCS